MLQKYHVVWLLAHPERSRMWLKARLADGFEVHHLDCNHANNVAENLVLIEGGDHRRLHGQQVVAHPQRLKRKVTAAGRRKVASADAYKKRLEGLSWISIGRKLGLPEIHAKLAAWEYARVNGLEWPPISIEKARELRVAARAAWGVAAAAERAKQRSGIVGTFISGE